ERVRAKVRPDVRDAYPSVDGRRRRRMARVDTTKAFLRPFASCREQLVGRVRQREEIVRCDRRRLRLRERGALCFEEALEIRPIAGVLTRVEQEVRRLGGLRLQ